MDVSTKMVDWLPSPSVCDCHLPHSGRLSLDCLLYALHPKVESNFALICKGKIASLTEQNLDFVLDGIVFYAGHAPNCNAHRHQSNAQVGNKHCNA